MSSSSCMSFEALHTEATANLQQHLAENTYPGRGLILGRNTAGEWTIVYWLMGRSRNSRNRILLENNGRLHTEAADPAKLEDPTLIIYNALRVFQGKTVVSNGDHTDRVVRGWENGTTFEETLHSERHEPDVPNLTPRIAGCLHPEDLESPLRLALIRSCGRNPELSEHHFFCYPAPASGLGHGLTTYQGDGNPLASFARLPLWFPLEGEGDRIVKAYWEVLNPDNRVALAVWTLSPGSSTPQMRICNRHRTDDPAPDSGTPRMVSRTTNR